MPRKKLTTPKPASAVTAPAASAARILLVDDHPIVRERLAELIHQQPDLAVCGEAEDASAAIRASQSLRPDLAIVDITLKDNYGIELIKHLKTVLPELPILVLSMHDESLFGERALRAGASGYLNKQEATKSVIDAIRRVLAGEIYASEKLSALIVQKLVGGAANGSSPIDVLSDRELEVFQLLGQGMSVEHVADRLFVSVKTVEAHREHIKRRMKLKSSAELLRYAMEFAMKGR